MSILEVVDALERVPRQGAPADEPEGARYVLCGEPHNTKYAEAMIMWSRRRSSTERRRK